VPCTWERANVERLFPAAQARRRKITPASGIPMCQGVPYYNQKDRQEQLAYRIIGNASLEHSVLVSFLFLIRGKCNSLTVKSGYTILSYYISPSIFV
jgi:hypothetical protein